MLALSGDYLVMGHRGLAAPVFDIDSVGLLSLFGDERGPARHAKPDTRLDRTDFFLGCVVTNSSVERGDGAQYLKLRKKAQAGARFVINQIGWDVRKDDELLRWIRREGLGLRALANVFLLSRASARAFRRGVIPGVIVTDELLAPAERHAASEDAAGPSSSTLAARHVAVARGLGFDGVYLGGHMPAETFGEILDLARSFGPDARKELARDSSPFEDEFYFFERDPETGLVGRE